MSRIVEAGKALLGLDSAPPASPRIATDDPVARVLATALGDAQADVRDCEGTLRSIDAAVASHLAKVAVARASLTASLATQAAAERELAESGDSGKIAAALATADRAVRADQVKASDTIAAHETATAEREQAAASLAAARLRVAAAQRDIDIAAARKASSLQTLHERCAPLARRFFEVALELQSIATSLRSALGDSNDALARLSAMTGERHPQRDGGHLLLAVAEDLLARDVIGDGTLSVLASECAWNGTFAQSPGRVADLLLEALRNEPSKNRADAGRELAARMREHPTYAAALYADRTASWPPHKKPDEIVAHTTFVPKGAR